MPGRNAVAINAPPRENFTKVSVDAEGKDVLENTGIDYNPDVHKPGAYRVREGDNKGFSVCCPCGCGMMYGLVTDDVPSGDPPSMHDEINIEYPGHKWIGQLLNGVWTEKTS